MAEPTTADFLRSFGPAQFEFPGVAEPALSNLADVVSADNFESASSPAEDVQVTTSVNKLNGTSLETQNVLLEPPQTSTEPPQTSASIASQEQGVGTFADEFA
jgi:hypothetical protein